MATDIARGNPQPNKQNTINVLVRECLGLEIATVLLKFAHMSVSQVNIDSKQYWYKNAGKNFKNYLALINN